MKVFNKKYKTNPTILHRPGCLINRKNTVHPIGCECSLNCRSWKNINTYFFKNLYNYKQLENITFVTWNNRKQKQLLENCLDHLNIKYICLGKNISSWNNTFKIKTLFEFKNQFKTDYVLGLDSFDVLFLGNIEKTLEEFEKFKSYMVFNACLKKGPEFQDAPIEEKIAPKDAIFKYINAGCWIAKNNFLQDFISELNDCVNQNKFVKSEQYFVREIFNKRYQEIKIDYYMKIFQAGIFEKVLFDIKLK